jgi:hypothetical protein
MEGWREREADRKRREHAAGTVSRDAGLRRVLSLSSVNLLRAHFSLGSLYKTQWQNGTKY